MIRLVATDIDGTLVEEGKNNINTELHDIVCELKKKGIVFAAASGRQYFNVRRLFEPVDHDMIFIAENGAYVVCRDVEIDVVAIERELVAGLVEDMRKLENCRFVACAKDALYVESKDEEFIDLLVNGYKYIVETVDDVLTVESSIIKLSIFKKDDIDSVAEEISPKWNDKLKVVVSGQDWMDFMELSVDKGAAIEKIQRTLGIAMEETMVFGDNLNDIGMFARAGESFAVGNARPEVKAAAKHIADTNVNHGVLKVLKGLLEKMEQIKEESEDQKNDV